MAQQEFQILVTTQDYLKLQSRCHHLELENSKLLDLNSKLLELTEQNNESFKKIKKLEENNKYLSLQGIKMAQTLLQVSRKQKKQQFQMGVQSQLGTVHNQKCSNCVSIKMQHDKITQQIKRDQQNLRQLKQKYDSISKQNQLLLKDKENNVNNSKQQQASIAIFKEELEQARNKLKIQTAERQRLSKELKMKIQQNQTLTKNMKQFNSIDYKDLKLQLEEWKQYGSVKVAKLDKAEASIKQYIDLVSGLQLQLKKNEKALKQNGELIQYYQQSEKQNDIIIRKLQTEVAQLKPKKNKQKSQIEEIRVMIQEYFVSMAFKFCDAGGMKPQDIEKKLRSQEDVVKKYIQDAIAPIIENLGHSSQNKMKLPNKIKM